MSVVWEELELIWVSASTRGSRAQGRWWGFVSFNVVITGAVKETGLSITSVACNAYAHTYACTFEAAPLASVGVPQSPVLSPFLFAFYPSVPR